jgi:hypothetical protein
VIAVDTNLLVYANRPEMPRHAVARRALTDIASRNARWAIPWPCVHEFYAVVTNARIFRTPATPAEAFAFLDALSGGGGLRFLGEGIDHLGRLRGLVESSGATGGGIHDARIAAICLSHGINELWSADRDFSRFPALKLVNPLVGNPPTT